MNAPAPTSFEYLRLFHRLAPASFIRQLCEKHGYGFRQGIYSASVVMWLMIWQRLHGNRSLAEAVQYLLQSDADDLKEPCKRCDENRISTATGSYCEARRRLPKCIVKEMTERLIAQLRPEMQEGWKGLQRPVFVVDGTSLRLQHTAELVREFSPGGNQHGENHWPVMRMVVLHDVFSGLALEPKWGPMYGDHAVSEQALGTAALESLPSDAVVLGDCNFGIFAFAWAVHQSRRAMVLRLSEPRAKKLLGGEIREETCREVKWQASRWEQTAHRQLPEGASLNGRIIICRNPSRPGEWLYLFTTLDVEPEEVMGIYKLRWRVETDLRSLKRTVELHHLNSKSVDMVEKELLSAVAAYNLVRAVMCLAARRANLVPSQLSYTFVRNVIEAALPGLDRASSEEEYRQRMDRVLHYAVQGKLPKRKRKRAYPREVWGRGGHFPSRSRGSADEEKSRS
jgi:hypothetical protein